MITFITHGLGGDASHWSNALNAENFNSEFAYEENSIIEKLRRKAGDADVYWARYYNSTFFDLFICPEYTTYLTVYDTSVLTKENILPSISEHIIVVFQDKLNSSDSLEDVYDKFHLMTDKIVYDAKVLNNGILPRINMIGHSMGGLINLMYALDHPLLVDSIFSFGTPYIGSDSAPIVTEAYDPQAQIDIVIPSIYSELYLRWQDGYTTKYSNINVHALGEYSTIDFLNYAVMSFQGNESVIGNINAINVAKAIVTVVNIILKVTPLEAAKLLTPTQIESIAGAFGKTVNGQAVHDFLNDIGYDTFWDFIFRRHVIYNDIFVDLDSQLGRGRVIQYDSINADGSYNFPADEEDYVYVDVEYSGFTREDKRFSVFNSDITNVSKQDIAIVHNLETQDLQFIKYVFSN